MSIRHRPLLPERSHTLLKVTEFFSSFFFSPLITNPLLSLLQTQALLFNHEPRNFFPLGYYVPPLPQVLEKEPRTLGMLDKPQSCFSNSWLDGLTLYPSLDLNSSSSCLCLRSARTVGRGDHTSLNWAILIMAEERDYGGMGGMSSAFAL